MGEENLYVVDTSVIIERAISKMVKKGELKGKIFIPKALLAELEHQANSGQEIGLLGLEELKSLQKLKKEDKIELSFIGERPHPLQIIHAKEGGEIDSMIRDIAYNEGATLITADKIQSESAKALGVEVLFLALKVTKKKLSFEEFFDKTTMSIHLKEDCIPTGKKGEPGNWKLIKITDKKLSPLKIQEIAKEIVEKARIDDKSFIEISRKGSTIVQYKEFRIVITKPPVSDGWELTIVKPLKQLDLEEYNLPTEIADRVKVVARGVIIAGEVGSGKSTFAQALAEYYASNNFIVKTVESPRDLILSDEITQYSKNFTSSEEIHDILFLSRPDYIIFDEMRDTPDFKLYTDLRLGGSNVLGVLHAATPVDAIQRFIGRLDTGMIPSVLDTILFINKGNIETVLVIHMTVKVPSGMTEADLARPVVVVEDFISGKVVFEIYSYGEETVVIPVSEEMSQDPVQKLASTQIENELLTYVDDVKVRMLSNNKAEIFIPERDVARIIGKQGKNIEKIEKSLGISLDVKQLTESNELKKGKVKFSVKETGKFIKFITNHPGKEFDVYIEGRFLTTTKATKKGEIKIHKKTKMGQIILDNLDSGKLIELYA